MPMGQRSRTETVAAVMAAFFAHRSWSQAELAREVGVRTEALRKLLLELQASGVHLESEKEHPHVYWSVPKTWFPGGVLFKQDDVAELLRQLGRLPRGKARDRLLAVIVDQLPPRERPTTAVAVVSRPTSEQEEQYVPVVEDSAAKRVALSMRYLTATRGTMIDRHASVHVVDVGPPARFIATCHRNGDLRWFRVDGVFRARLDDREPYRECSAGAVAAFRAASIDGFKGAGSPVLCSFFVREPESRWVANNLLEGMTVENRYDGIRVSIETSGLVRLARFVVGLGGAARPETVALVEAVAELARGALEQVQGRAQETETQAILEEPARGPAQPRSDA
jgi:predicted DNA-binding transcriptional regulator YafY